jgi:hypothetical protein
MLSKLHRRPAGKRRTATFVPLTAAFVMLAYAAVAAGPAQASTTIDIRGTFTAQGQGGSPYTLTLTDEDCSTGVVSGSASGGIGPETGTLNGSTLMLHEHYGGYTSDITATVSADNQKISGTFHDSNNVTAPWNATRTSGPPATPSPGCGSAGQGAIFPATITPPTAKEKLKPRIGVVVSCGVDACLAEVDGILRVVLNGGKVLAAPAKAASLKLPHTSAQLAPNTTTTVQVSVPKKILKKAKAAKAAGGKVTAAFSVKLTTGGQQKTAQGTTKLT